MDAEIEWVDGRAMIGEATLVWVDSPSPHRHRVTVSAKLVYADIWAADPDTAKRLAVAVARELEGGA